MMSGLLADADRTAGPVTVEDDGDAVGEVDACADGLVVAA